MNPLSITYSSQRIYYQRARCESIVVVALFWLFLLTISYIFLVHLFLFNIIFCLSIIHLRQRSSQNTIRNNYTLHTYTRYIYIPACLWPMIVYIHTYLLCNICGHLVDVIEDIVLLRFIAKGDMFFGMRFVLLVLQGKGIVK